MKIKLISISVFVCLATQAGAQTKAASTQSNELNEQDVITIEELYKTNPPPQQSKAPPVETAPETTAEEQKQIENIQNSSDYKKSQVKTVSDLNSLAPFSDISVIQKRYLPKTERFQVYGALGVTTNSPWFLSAGGKINAGYHFTEKWGVEFSGMFLSSSEKDSAKQIRSNNSLEPERFVLTKSHLGIDLVWAPIYGKITSLNNEITPFDMYFSGGLGQANTTGQEKNVTSFHLATGQIFALSKSMAFRWDYSWYMYQATPQVDSLTSTPEKSSYNDLIFTAGVSFFFPDAGYR
jgi:outer membrane beta-barrel protein